MRLTSFRSRISMDVTRSAARDLFAFALTTGVAVCLLGCRDEEACTKARLEASDAWKKVYESASTNKVSPQIGLEEIGEERKAAHVGAWGTIETQAEMIFKSFAYPHITWNTADPARDKTRTAFDQYFAKDKFRTFQTSLADAEQKYKLTSDLCRD